MAVENGRLCFSSCSRSAQACGFVSMTTVKRDGAGSIRKLIISSDCSLRRRLSQKQKEKDSLTMCTRLIVLGRVDSVHTCNPNASI